MNYLTAGVVNYRQRVWMHNVLIGCCGPSVFMVKAQILFDNQTALWTLDPADARPDCMGNGGRATSLNLNIGFTPPHEPRMWPNSVSGSHSLFFVVKATV